MTEYTRAKQDYLKLEPKNPAIYLSGAISDLVKSRLDFGHFSSQILDSTEKKWAVVKFCSYSKDRDAGTRYNTHNDALQVALTHLDQKGFNATPFDLEGMIENIKVKDDFGNANTPVYGQVLTESQLQTN